MRFKQENGVSHSLSFLVLLAICPQPPDIPSRTAYFRPKSVSIITSILK